MTTGSGGGVGILSVGTLGVDTIATADAIKSSTSFEFGFITRLEVFVGDLNNLLSTGGSGTSNKDSL